MGATSSSEQELPSATIVLGPHLRAEITGGFSDEENAEIEFPHELGLAKKEEAKKVVDGLMNQVYQGGYEVGEKAFEVQQAERNVAENIRDRVQHLQEVHFPPWKAEVMREEPCGAEADAVSKCYQKYQRDACVRCRVETDSFSNCIQSRLSN